MAGARELLKDELTWAARFEPLKDAGYILRPRYRPGWVADWENDFTSFATPSEAAILPSKVTTLDARRIKDNTFVFLKVSPKDGPEVEINRYLSSPELRKDIRNPAAPLLDVVELPDEPDIVLLVFPMLRRIGMPYPETVGEYVDFVEQSLEGLVFLHEHQIAHRDCSDDNMMMDGRRLFPRGWHPQSGEMSVDAELMVGELHPSRSLVGGVRYYYVDFGLSSRGTSKVLGLDGQIRAPELSDEIPYDPFMVDVYDLGLVFNYYIYKRRPVRELEFVASLIKYMTPPRPEDRPTATEALKYFHKLRADLTADALAHRFYRTRYKSGFNRIWFDVTYRLKELWLRYHPMPPLPSLE